MITLGIETATSVCGAAVCQDDRVVSESFLDERRVHAEKLMTLIDRVLVDSHRGLGDLDGIAISIGPGSFTGLRIGLSAAKGFGFACGKPLVAVSTLHAFAQHVVDVGAARNAAFVLPMLDARRDEVYCQLFTVNQLIVQPVWEVRDCTLAKVLEDLPEENVLVAGDAVQKFKTYLAKGPMRPDATLSFVEFGQVQCSAGSVALLGARQLQQGQRDDPVTMEPHYIKEFFLEA